MCTLSHATRKSFEAKHITVCESIIYDALYYCNAVVIYSMQIYSRSNEEKFDFSYFSKMDRAIDSKSISNWIVYEKFVLRRQ